MSSEARVEQTLIREVRKLGGQCHKLIPTVAGIPDRLVLLPHGRIYLVELKAPGGKLRPAQEVWHARAKAIGIEVVVLEGKDQVMEWITHSCGAEWKNRGAAHCAACHRTFNSTTAFDAHRSKLTCMDPVTLLRTDGTPRLVRLDSGQWAMADPQRTQGSRNPDSGTQL